MRIGEMDIDITEEQRVEIISALEGSTDWCVSKYDELDLCEFENIMFYAGYERCCECGIWVETSELVDEDNEVCSCYSCGNNPKEF